MYLHVPAHGLVWLVPLTRPWPCLPKAVPAWGHGTHSLQQVWRLQAGQLQGWRACAPCLEHSPLVYISSFTPEGVRCRPVCHQVLDAYTPVLSNAAPSDTALLLVTVARLHHVSSYSWLQGVLDHCQDSMLAFDGQVRTGCTHAPGPTHR